MKPVIKSETGVSSASPDAGARPAALAANVVSVLQKECIPTSKRTKHETEAASSSIFGYRRKSIGHILSFRRQADAEASNQV
jgi:hypothetical protein